VGGSRDGLAKTRPGEAGLDGGRGRNRTFNLSIKSFENPMLVSPPLRIEDQHTELTKAQLDAVAIFLSRDKIIGLDGVAGAGKTTTLAVIREGAEAQRYMGEGFAPTSWAAQKLSEAGMKTSTVQHYLIRGEPLDAGERRLFVLDESSLASTHQMHEFVMRLHRNDRVLLVGDTRQHEGVEAGRPFAELQDAGMRTVKLGEILRQRDPELKQAVEQLARGQVGAAIESLDHQGRVHEVKTAGIVSQQLLANMPHHWKARWWYHQTTVRVLRLTGRFTRSCNRVASRTSKNILCECLCRARR
jgi:ATP-dependent exoDNAse (exonuclease V) alpha subunit